MVEDRLETMVASLRKEGYRITPQRLAVLKVLAEGTGHPDAGDIHRKVSRQYPAMSLATVYKTIAQLKKLDQVLELEFSGHANRYDGNKPYAHPHVLCASCGKIVDPEVLDMEKITADLSRSTGFRIHNTRLDFFGTCPACQRKGK